MRVTPKQLVVGRATFSHQVFGRSANGHCWKCDLQRAVQHHVQSFLFSGLPDGPLLERLLVPAAEKRFGWQVTSNMPHG